MRDITFRCRHFRTDRPCVFHKEQGMHCSSCPHKDLIEHCIQPDQADLSYYEKQWEVMRKPTSFKMSGLREGAVGRDAQ
jgi:hypothetical protein